MTVPLLPAGPLRRCRCCHRPVPSGPLYDGYGEKCAEKRGLIPAKVRLPSRRSTAGERGPDLLGLLRRAAPLTEGDGEEDEDASGDVTEEFEAGESPGGHPPTT